ncbi:26S proteasome regulatory subunit-like protein [Metarhizium album ARSEF 1941]|uniref:26S proteasome regulatory subunit-like protein n=1 Tax=Metarhizium album (strain ARSEF 1941) TaxID=1081103 RepID=A0A0B2WW68_METAS|nr:26S proteasome regulatory subunit-like protein [Metarhizium album ARSEF 1941]KHN97844.1 26S proteasome regulatory subunit-like protein [Metarhizium album ARSEF 1941]
MISSPISTVSDLIIQSHNYQHPSHLHYPHQYRNEEDLLDDIPALDSDSERRLLFGENLHPLQVFGDYSTHPMQSDSWGGLAQLTPKIRRFSHQRESSLSSLGSNGPASPYTQNTSNPQIAISESTFEGFPDMNPQEITSNQSGSYYPLAKSMGCATYQTYHGIDGAVPEVAYPVTVPGPGKRLRMDEGLLPAPELAGTYNRSNPASVASSVAGDSPATPAVGEPDQKSRRKNGKTPMTPLFSGGAASDLALISIDHGHIPKLDRTMTDVYGDELYNPNFTITATSSPQPQSVTSAESDVFNQRINAANHQHLSAAHSPSSTTSRARSPFRTGSPFAASSSHQFSCSQTPPREHGRHTRRPFSHPENAGEPATPKTISPKDAVLEFNESEADSVFPLFPQDSSGFEIDPLSKTAPSSEHSEPYIGQNMETLHQNDQFGYLPSQMPVGIQAEFIWG